MQRVLWLDDTKRNRMNTMIGLVCFCVIQSLLVYAGNRCCGDAALHDKKGEHILNSFPDTQKQREKNENLFNAVANGRVDTVKNLLAARANVDCKFSSRTGGQPLVLMDAALIRGNVSLAVLLRDHGAPLPHWDALQKYHTTYANNEEVQKFLAHHLFVQDDERSTKR